MIGIQKGTIILTIPHMPEFKLSCLTSNHAAMQSLWCDFDNLDCAHSRRSIRVFSLSSAKGFALCFYLRRGPSTHAIAGSSTASRFV